jgi:hypothetical protein
MRRTTRVKRMGRTKRIKKGPLEGEGEDQNKHYAITIGHILQDDTTKAFLESDTEQQAVSIPSPFLSMPGFLRFQRGYLHSFTRLAAQLPIPPGTSISCSIPGVDCRGLFELVGEPRSSYYYHKESTNGTFECSNPFISSG